MMARVPKSWQTPDILVLNAAVTPFLPRPLSETELETYEQALTDELRAAFSPVSVLAPRMAQAGRGCILAVSSTLCRMPRAGFSTIAVSKGALEAFVRSVAAEYGPAGVRANIIEASMIEGDSSAFMSADRRQAIIGSIPLGRISRSEDVAGAIVVAASDLGAFINGATIPVNGGQSMN
jgi:3-oxoacyl-[acyl-carrier protein] reductase